MIVEISLYVYFFLWLKNVKMKLLIIDDDCYIRDSGRCECYTNVHVINPMTRENKTKEANWEGIHGWIYLNEHTVISIHVDKMIIYNY